MFKPAPLKIKQLFQSSKYFRSHLKQRLSEVFPKKVAQFREYRRKYGDYDIGSLTVNDVLDGCISSPILFYEGSVMDPKTVIYLFFSPFSYIFY